MISDELIHSTLKLLEKMTGDELFRILDLADKVHDAGIDPVQALRDALESA